MHDECTPIPAFETLPLMDVRLLDQLLDWDNKVDKDLCNIAEHMTEWEEMSANLKLSASNIHDIKFTTDKPKLQR